VNASGAGSASRRRELLGIADRTEINTFVIDVKEAGEVTHRSGVALAAGAARAPVDDLGDLVAELAERRIHAVARIAVFRDPVLAAVRPDWALRTGDGATWADARGLAWTDPFNPAVWEYNVAIAREALDLGFAEIQLDYARFPDVGPGEVAPAIPPGRTERSAVIATFIELARHELGLRAPVTVAVFGSTTTGGKKGIGQRWDRLIAVADALHPMVYPSHYLPGAFGLDDPNAHPYETVRGALDAAVRRTTGEVAARIQPWLQDFSLGEPPYGSAEVRAQIRAVYDAGLDGWLLWNSRSTYTVEALDPAP
jgi:hypothetical protein